MARLDEEIKKDVVDQLYWDDRVDAAKINVQVNNGSVTLTGNVPTYLAREVAIDNAWTIQGVIDVINSIDVQYSKEITLPTDSEIRIDIENVLTTNPDISIDDLEVKVDSGIVNLEGTVDAYWKTIHAEDLISTLPGILGIRNNLTVVPTKSYVDEVIAKDVVAALERNEFVDADKVNVKVEDGVVTLTGNLLTRLAVHETHKAALYSPGVLSVNNNLIIAA